jgi:hypothetical membrane protein
MHSRLHRPVNRFACTPGDALARQPPTHVRRPATPLGNRHLAHCPATMSSVRNDDRSDVRASPVRIGAAMWVGTLQFFVVEAAVQWRWRLPYDRRDYYISDLGALHCAASGDGRSVCSPWHALMNGSFVVQGLLIAGGALLLHVVWSRASSRRKASLATALLVLAGGGVALVGLAPEDALPAVHVSGAAANFLAGNLGLVLLFFVVRAASGSATGGSGLGAVWAGLLGAIGLAALVSFAGGADWGLGDGGIERVIAYPLPAALPVVAIGVLLEHAGKRHRLRTNGTPAD